MNKMYATVIYSEISSPLSHPLSWLQILHSTTFTQTAFVGTLNYIDVSLNNPTPFVVSA